MHPQTTPNQVPMSEQYHQSPTQVPLAPISTPMANHPTTSSQPTSQNNGHVYYMTYSDDDSIFNDDKDEESGNTRPWQTVVKKKRKNEPSIQTNRTP